MPLSLARMAVLLEVELCAHRAAGAAGADGGPAEPVAPGGDTAAGLSWPAGCVSAPDDRSVEVLREERLQGTLLTQDRVLLGHMWQMHIRSRRPTPQTKALWQHRPRRR